MDWFQLFAMLRNVFIGQGCASDGYSADLTWRLPLQNKPRGGSASRRYFQPRAIYNRMGRTNACYLTMLHGVVLETRGNPFCHRKARRTDGRNAFCAGALPACVCLRTAVAAKTLDGEMGTAAAVSNIGRPTIADFTTIGHVCIVIRII